MFKKELIDSVRTLAQSLIVLLLIPIAMVLDWHVLHAQWEVAGMFQPLFLAIIIIFAAYAGVSIFGMEKKDKAMEYLLSLPVPIWKIMIAKILPRLILLLILIVTGGVLGVLQSIVVDSISLLIVFLLAVSLSLAVESAINAMVGVLLLNVILYYSSLIASYLTMTHHVFRSEVPLVLVSQLLPALLLLVPFVTAFVLAMKRLDLKPLKWQGKPYQKIALPALVALILFILLFLKNYLVWINVVE